MRDSYNGYHRNLDENMSLRVSLNWGSIPVVVSQISAGLSGWVGCRQKGRKGEGTLRYRNGMGADFTMPMCIRRATGSIKQLE